MCTIASVIPKQMPSPLFVLPRLTTPRLVLRAFTLNDVPDLHHAANDYDVALNLAALPHPYSLKMAHEWVQQHDGLHARGTHRIWAITPARPLADGYEILGTISLVDIDTDHSLAELGYWLGKEYWSCGYATEAARAVLQYAFEEMQLERIFAKHFERNPASGRVLQKIGMQREGTLRHHYCKWGEYQNLVVYGMLHHEWFLKY
jgi:[ribosomal protein S5]-alanine N-acetyltransferase